MGYVLSAVAIFIVTLIAEVIAVVLIGMAGAFVIPLVAAGAIIAEMVRQVRRGHSSRATAVCVSGLSILIPVTVALVAYPEIPGMFFVLDALFGSGLDTAQFTDMAAAITLLLMIAWVLGGGYLALNAIDRISGEGRRISEEALLSYTMFVIAWGLTASPVFGWWFGGLAELARSWF